LKDAGDGSATIVNKLRLWPSEDLARASLVYCHHGQGRLSVFSPNCVASSHDGYSLVSEGSGHGDLFWDRYGAPQVRPSAQHPAWEALGRRLGEYIHRELNDPDHYREAFGGGYEVIIPKAGSGFRKLNYCLDQFLVTEDSLGHVSRLQCSYRGRHLETVKLCSMEVGEESSYPYQLQTMSIPDILSSPMPRRTTLKELLQCEDPVIFSYVLNPQNRSFSFSSGRIQRLRFWAEKRKQGLTVEPEYLSWAKGQVERTTRPEKVEKVCNGEPPKGPAR
jgi:hypothetical protein